jgi:hypothetical protein
MSDLIPTRPVPTAVHLPAVLYLYGDFWASQLWQLRLAAHRIAHQLFRTLPYQGMSPSMATPKLGMY